ncbi:MAG TPA: hypothetical protein VGY54_07105 [Polyangiaceae bacterium]|nr:hypothetical protein [Polyangiaceae bacterium]
MFRSLFGTASVAFATLLTSATKAEPPAAGGFSPSSYAVEDAVADGDLDEEDRLVAQLGADREATDVHGRSWLGVALFEREFAGGQNDIGATVVLGLALDRIAAGAVRPIGDAPRDLPRAPPSVAGRLAAFPPSLARDCVAAAWRTSGLGVNDARIDSIATRSRSSALLPEARLRAMRLWTDATRTTTLTTADGTNYYDTIGAHLALEIRLTWRLDRWLYAGDEPTLERVRLLRQDARSRLGIRTLEVLFAWERAMVDASLAVAGSEQELDARMREQEKRGTLDVLTGGWFSERLP